MCHQPIVDTKRLPQEIQDKVYRPGEDERYNVTVDFKNAPGKSREEVLIDPEPEPEAEEIP